MKKLLSSVKQISWEREPKRARRHGKFISSTSISIKNKFNNTLRKRSNKVKHSTLLPAFAQFSIRFIVRVAINYSCLMFDCKLKIQFIVFPLKAIRKKPKPLYKILLCFESSEICYSKSFQAF
jgi:hypothetical protein